jgi:malate dehydrogenase
MYADYRFATIGGKGVKDMINDQVWNADVFLPTVGKRGAAIIDARGLSSAASAANAAIDHIHDWVLGTPEGDWVSMGVAVDGQYGIDKGIICGLPCVAKNGQWSVVEGLELDAFSKPRIDASVAELREEYDAVKELGLI